MIENNIPQGPTGPEPIKSSFTTSAPATSYAQTVLNKYKPAVSDRKLNPFSGGITSAVDVPIGSAGSRFPYYSPFLPSNEDLYGSYQSWYSKAGNGIMKGAGLALTTFLNGTVGLIAGIGNAIADGKMSSLYDNEFTQSLDEFNSYMENSLPNYYSDKERDAAWYSPDNLFTSNFLFDKVIKNLGFSVGAMGAGLTYSAALRSLGLFSKVASAGGLARTAALTEDAINAVPSAYRSAAANAGIRAAASEFLTNFNTLNTAQRVVASGLSTIGEANFEALQQLNDYRQKLISEYVQQHGIRPTDDDLTQINQYAERAGNVIFALNVPLLTATNYIQLPKILGSSYQAERRLFTNGIREAEHVAFDSEAKAFVSTLPKTKFGKALYRAKNFASLFFSPSESFEELSQTSFNFGVNNYFDKARRGGNTDIFQDLFVSGYQQGLSTKEGLESAIIGGLSGGIFEMRSQINEKGFTGFGGEQSKTSQAAIATFNKQLFSGFLNDTRYAVNRGNAIQADRMEAIRRGDILEAKDLQTDYTLNYLAPRIQYGRFDLVKDDIDMYKKLASTPQGLQQLKDEGVVASDITSEQLLGRIRNMETHADNVNELYQALNIRYSGQLNDKNERIYPDEVISKMVYAAAKVADYDQRIPELISRLNSHEIFLEPLFDELAKSAEIKERYVAISLDDIKKLDVLADVKEDLRTNLRDVLELTLRRKEFLRQYDQLKNKPAEYISEKYGTEPLDPETNELELPQMDENGDITYRDFTVDHPYRLGDHILRNGNKFSYNPTVQMGRPSLLGDIRLDYSDGRSEYRFADQISDINLQDPLSEIEDNALTTKLAQAASQLAQDLGLSELEEKFSGKTFEQILPTINDLNDAKLSDQFEQAFKSAIDEFEKGRRTLKTLADNASNQQIESEFTQADNLSSAIPTAPPDEDKPLIDKLQSEEGSKKHITVLFRSSTSEDTSVKGTGENDDFHRRANKFLENLDKLADRASIRVAVVTVNNQKELGLEHLIGDVIPGSQTPTTDINEGTIRLVFVRTTPSGDFFVDVDGNDLGPVGTAVDFSKLVYTTMPSTSLTWRNGVVRYISTGKRAATQEKAITFQDAYRLKRTQMLSRTKGYEIFPFSVSRGFATYEQDGVQHPVTSSLVTPEMLNTPLIVIPTLSTGEVNSKPVGSIIHNEETIDLPLGRPVLQKGATLVPLNNSKLPLWRKILIKKLLVRMSEQLSEGHVDRAILNYLQGLIYWRKPASGKSATKGQIWYQSGYLYLGSEKNRVPFLADIVQSSVELDQFLDQVYVSANNFLLTQRASLPFNEIIDIDPSGKLIQVQWKTYQHFLLSPTYVTTVDDASGFSGNIRMLSEIPFTTDIMPVGPTNDPYASTFQQRYVTLHSFDLFPHTASPGAASDVIDDATFSKFTDKNEVAPNVLASIAHKVITRQKLSVREEAILAGKIAEINKIIASQSTTQSSTPPGEQGTSSESETKPPPTKAGKFILDGVTMNKLLYEKRRIADFSAKIETNGQITITGYEHRGKNQLTEEEKNNFIALAVSQIAEALVKDSQKSTKANLSAPSQTAPADQNSTAPTEEYTTSDNEGTAEQFPNPATPTAESNPPSTQSGQVTANDIFKNLRPNRSGNGISGGQYRLISQGQLIGPVKTEDLSAFKNYIEQVLPGVPLHVVSQLIETTDGGFAWGAFADNAIYLYQHAEEGTGYHEVFEAVFTMFLNAREKSQILAEFASRDGYFTDRETGENVSYSQANQHQAKEQLAEEFRAYNLTGQLPTTPKAVGFFRRLLNFIKSILLGKRASVKDLFTKINSGFFANKPVLQPDTGHGIEYRRKIIEGLNTKFIQEAMEGMTALVFDELFSNNRSLVELDEFNLSLMDLYNKVFERLTDYFDNVLPSSLLADLEDAQISPEEAEKAKAMYADSYNKTWLPIKTNWRDFVSLNESFLKPFNIFFDSDDDQAEKEASINNDDKSSREYDRDIMKISAKRNAATSIKLLFATLTQVEESSDPAQDGQLPNTYRKLSPLWLPKLVNYSRTFNRLLYEVLGSVSPSHMVNKIKALAQKDNTYVRLFNRLKVTEDYSQLSLHDWKLLIKLFNVASKQRPDYFIQIEDETGKTFMANANDNRLSSQIVKGWIEQMKSNAGIGKLIYVDNNRFRIDGAKLEPFRTAVKEDVDGKIRFLNFLGIKFSKEDYNNLKGGNRAKFNRSAQSLFNLLVKSQDVATISGRGLGIAGPLTHLAEVVISLTGDNSEGQHFSIEGEPVQTLLLHNYVSVILNELNFHPTKEALVNALPHLEDIFSQDSQLLENGGILFDDQGIRRIDPINISVIEGSKKLGPRPGTPTTKLTLAGRRLQEFNQNVNGIYYVLLPADSSTEWSLNLSKQHYVAYSEMFNEDALSNKLFRIFSSYLRTEMQLVADYQNRAHNQNIKKQGKALRFFKGILESELSEQAIEAVSQGQIEDWITNNRPKIISKLKAWIENMADSQFNFFREYELITTQDGKTFTFKGLDSDFKEEHKIGDRLSEEDVRKIISFRTINYSIQNIEFHKIFFGDPALYSDPTKRIKSFLSGRETTYHTDNHFNSFANDHLNTTSLDQKGIALLPGEPGYWVFKDAMATITLADVNTVGSLALSQQLPAQIRAAYSEANEADAQSWMSLTGYRELLLKAGGRWTDAMEQQFQYEMAYERYTKSLNKEFSYKGRKKLEKHDKEIIAAGNPHIAIFHPIKPIGTGIKAGSEFADIFLDKTSALPIYYRMAQGTNLEKLHNRMSQEGLSYVIMESGRKVGAQGLHSLYAPDGTVSDAASPPQTLVPFKYFGIQLETSGSKSKQTRGTQLTKLAVINLLASGVPIDVDMDYATWNALTEEEKIRESNVYELVSKNTAILNAMTEKGYAQALEQLGINETEDGFEIADYNTLATFLAQEADSRDLPDNIRDGIDIDPDTGKFTFPLEALTNYRAVKSILYSIVDKKLLRPKLPGGPKVQVSSTMFEANERQAVYKPGGDTAAAWQKVDDYTKLSEAEQSTVRLTSNHLKFYTKEEPWIEVLVPHWFKEKLQKAGSDKTDAEILDYLNKTKSTLLFGIGFRIPTQELNSVEHIRIKGFLPAEMGDTIVVPTEIVVKAGSDFDIDKLNTYLKNFFINKDGYPEAVKLLHADTNSPEGRKKLYDYFFGHIDNFLRLVDRLYTDAFEQGNIPGRNTAATGSDATHLLGLINEDLYKIGIDPDKYRRMVDQHIPFEKFETLIAGKNLYEIYAEFDPEALENEYILTLQHLLSLPGNFERLIQPNSADELKNLRNELNTALGKQSMETKGNFSLLLDPNYMSEVRHNFLSGKGGVGIAALQQTNTSLAQLSGLVLDHRNFENKLSLAEKKAVRDMTVNLPHNSITIGQEKFISISNVKDTIGQYISDKISAYINGYVDVAKDAFIVELGANMNVARIYLFLEKIGVPTRDVIFFMNQPIIRQYLKALSIKGISVVHSQSTTRHAATVRQLFPTKSIAKGPIKTADLKSYIQKYAAKGALTEQENGIQQQILSEFLKYSVFSDHLFALTQASNYDTDRLGDVAMVYRKQVLSEQASRNNLFDSIDKIFNATFLGKVKQRLGNLKDALGKVFVLDNDTIGTGLQQVLKWYVQPHQQVSSEDFLTVAIKLQSSFLDYITQLAGMDSSGNLIEQLMLSETSVAHQLSNLKKSLPATSDLAQNIILSLLEPLYDNAIVSEPKNIRLTEKPYDSYTANLYTEAMRDLRKNVHTRELYDNLVKLSILQSGSRRSPISFTEIIPIEDYAPVVSRALNSPQMASLLASYIENYAFQRIHYWDERVVPTIEAKEIESQFGNFIPIYNVPERLYRNLGTTVFENQFIRLNTQYQSRESLYPVVKIREIAIDPATKAPYSLQQQAEMRKNGDYSYFQYKLFQKVMLEDSNGEPVGLSFPEDPEKKPGVVNYIYKQINAWGKPGLVQEYYSYPRASVIGSNTQVKEFSDQQVIAAFENKSGIYEQSSDNNTAPIPSKASADTIALVKNFLDKIGVSVQQVNTIVVDGQKLNANALADTSQRLIQVVNGHTDTALTEEAMHFAVEIIEQKKPTLFNSLLREIGKYDIYGAILSSYSRNPLYQKNGKPDIIKLKKEAIARILVETVINHNEEITEKPELLAQTKSWWEKILEFLKGLFNRAGFNPFQQVAEQIVEGTFAGNAQDLNLDTAQIYLQQDSKQNEFVNRVLNMHRQLSKETSATDANDSYYVLAGKRIANRVTNLAKKYYERKFKNKQINETELQKALNDQKKEKGTDGHSDLEDIFHRLVDENGYLRPSMLPQTIPSRLDPVDNSYYRTLENNLMQRLQSFQAGTRFFSELMIYDQDQDMAGTIDLLAIEPDNSDGSQGKIHILDWKFINLKEGATDIPPYKKEAWNIQISEYIKMLVKPAYGAAKSNFGMTRAIPIKALYTFSDPERTRLKLYAVEIGSVNVSAINDDTILPVPTRYESTGNKDLDNLIFRLNTLYDKIVEQRTDPGTEYVKTQRLNEILLAIRRLHVKNEVQSLFKFAKNDIYNFNTFFKKYFQLLESPSHTMTDKEINELSARILDAEDVLSLYKDFNITFRKIFSYQDPTHKPILQESEMISDDAELVLTRLLRLAGSLRTNPIARGVEVEDYLQPEKVVTWYQKWVRSLSQGATKATEILWGIVNRINTAIQIEFSDEIEKLKALETEISDWVKTNGKSFTDVSDMIFGKDSKKRWNGRIISAVAADYYSELADALAKKDHEWVMENIDSEEYMKWFKEELELRRQTYLNSRLLENEQDDEALKTKRLNEFIIFHDIVNHPETSIHAGNFKLKSFPNMSKWRSSDYQRLHQPENSPILKLYDYWQQRLAESYKLGMIKAWEQKTFFPNVRRDFLDKLVFGTKEGVAKTANLAFLNSIRIEATDEVFGYTDINGNPQDRMGAMYIYDLGNKITDKDGEIYTDYSNKSTDLFKVMGLWNKEIIKYKHKSEYVDTVRLLHFTEKNRKAIGRSKKTGGIAYKENGEPVYVDNVENSDYFKNFMDYYFYDKRLSEGQDVTFQLRYNPLAKKINKFFHADLMPMSNEEEITISGRKLIRAFNRFFQMKTLGVNLATAVSNLVGGKVNAYMLAGKYFTKLDYSRAALQMTSAKFHTDEGKIYAGLLNYFLPLTEDRTGEQIRQLSVSRAVKLLSSDHLFYMMRTSDKMVQYPVALAMFANTMVENDRLVNIREFVKQKNGYSTIYSLSVSEQKTLRDKIEKEIAELKATRSLPVIARIVDDKVVIDGITRSEKDIAGLRNQIQQFSKDALGNMSEDDISQYRLTLLGQSFMMFKNWIPRMADVRFGELRYQAGTDAYEWGRVSMLFNALKHGILSGTKASLATLVGSNGSLIEIAKKIYASKVAEYEANGQKFKMTEADFIDMYVKGIRTQLKEVAVMMSMLGTLLFAKAQAPDDDDDRTSGFYKWITRTLDKLTDELGFFLNPLSFTSVANGSVFPSVQLLNDIVKFTSSMALESYYMVTGDQQAQDKNKVLKYLFKTFPVSKEMMTYLAMFNDDLAKEYGITISNRARMR